MGLINKKVDQSIFDVLLENGGALSGLFDFLHANNLTSLDIPTGAYVAPEVMKQEVVDFYAKLNESNDFSLASSDTTLPAYTIIVQAINTLNEVIASSSFAPGTGVQELPIPNGTVKAFNTLGDELASDTYVAGTDAHVEVPNIIHIDSDGTEVDLPSNIPMICTPTPDPNIWMRPSEWIALPDISTTDKRAVGIFAVFEGEENAASISIGTVSSIAYSINWGDGTTTNVTGTTAKIKRYDYTAISGAILQDSYGRNYKQVLIQITFTSGAATTVNLGAAISNGGSNNWLDIAINWSTSWPIFSRYPSILQRFQIFSANYSSVNANNYYNGMGALRNLKFIANTASATSSQQMFAFIGNIDEMDFTWNSAVTAYGFFQQSAFKKLGNISMPSVNSTGNMFYGCSHLVQLGNININLSTSMAQMFYYCTALQKIGTISNTSATNIQYAFGECNALREIIFTSAANILVTTGAFYNCLALRTLRLPGIKVSFTIAGCNLRHQALIDLFNDLGTPVTTQVIIITNNPGSVSLTAADILIATSKNWTVTL